MNGKLLAACFIMISSVAFAQVADHPAFPQQSINAALHDAYINSMKPVNNAGLLTAGKSQPATSVFNALSQMKQPHHPVAKAYADARTEAVDTVIVGAVPHDTLRITGSYFNNGPILVANDGVLIFHNADATIVGDIYALGQGRILADSSSLTFPQQYFYQLGLTAVNNAYVHLETCSLSYGGLSHNLLAADSATIELINIHNNDWTTAGTYGSPTITLNGSNMAGEYILSDYSRTSFTNVNTLLLWHQFPDSSVINFSFPNGDTLNHYVFNNSVSGVKGIEYNVAVDSCVNVWWGMMPVNGSDITISNSKIRSIGAWFESGDTVTVSGLVDNSNYSDFTAPLTDRHFHLINSSVETWSLYTFDSSRINISSCILGEVGGEGHATILSDDFFLDGSGGYFWAADTSLVIASSTAVTSNVRSEHNGFFVYGYGTVASGIASAINNSLLIVVQSSLPQDPVAYDGAIAWFANIAGPASAYADSVVPVIGSAWIDAGPLGSSWMSYGKYSLYYQLQGDTSWHVIVKDSTAEIRNTALAMWNTHGLQPNNYLLQLVVYNNLDDSVPALKNIALAPSVLGVDELNKNDVVTIFPDPVINQLRIKNGELRIEKIRIYNALGELLTTESENFGSEISTDVSNLPAGIYFVEMDGEKESRMQKFVKE